MQFIVAAVGQRMPGWVQEAWAEYARRFPKPFSLDLREIPLQKRAKNADIERLRDSEGQALLSAVPPGFRMITMDERGKQCSTVELARQMEYWMREERGICLLVGGPDGLSRECRQSSHQSWSLGKLTLPHPLVRVVLAEQIYRAWSITQNHPYHRAG
jgi:23S rRNA (pseudouridine1915-N3)-methyltransferase